MNWTTKVTDKNAPLSMLERFAYACGWGGSYTGYALATSFLLFFYTNYAHLNAGIVGTIFLVCKVMDAGTDLIMGHIIDRTRSPKGQARVWFFRACIPYAIATILLFCVPAGIPDFGKYVYVFITYTLYNCIFFTAIAVSWTSMNTLLTQSSSERGVLGVIGNLFANSALLIVTAITMNLVNRFGNDQRAWIIVVGIYTIISLVLHLCCYAGTTERCAAEKDDEVISLKDSLKSLIHNKYWLMFALFFIGDKMFQGVYNSSVAYYSNYVLNSETAVGLINGAFYGVTVFMLIIGAPIIKKLGKGRCFFIGTITMCIGVLSAFFIGPNLTGQFIASLIKGLGSGFVSCALNGMGSDTVDYGEWKTGIRTTGAAWSVASFASKLGAGLGSAIMGWILSFTGFDASLAQQSSSALTGINMCFIWIPLVFYVIMMVTASQYRLDKEFPQIVKDLEERKAAKHSAV